MVEVTLPGAGRRWVTVVPDGAWEASGPHAVDVPAEGRRTLRVALGRPRQLEVHVRSSAGQPVAGAEVQLWSGPAGATPAGLEAPVYVRADSFLGHAGSTLCWEKVVANEEGEAALRLPRVLEPASFFLVAQSPERLRVVHPLDASAVRSGGRVEVVLGSGARAILSFAGEWGHRQRVRVRFVAVDEPAFVPQPDATGVLAADGASVELLLPAAGAWTAMLRVGRTWLPLQRFVAEAGSVPAWELDAARLLWPASPLEVRDGQGKSVDGNLVLTFLAGSARIELEPFSSTAGTVHLPSLAAGTYHARLEPSGQTGILDEPAWRAGTLRLDG